MHFNYHNSMTCRWKIFPEGSGPITLSFTSFRTQRGHDFVKIYDYNTGEQLADYSGDYSSPNLPPPVTATSGQMFILFATDASVTDEGWEARYSAALGCNNLPSPVPMKVFPNPVSDVLTIQTGQTTAGTIKIEVSDVKGDIVLHENLAVTGNSVKLNVSGLSPGVYFMRITSGNETLVRKVIIERQ
jgi:hypothetical protein